MIEIEGVDYPIEVVKKALKLYEALNDGSLEAEIVEMIK